MKNDEIKSSDIKSTLSLGDVLSLLMTECDIDRTASFCAPKAKSKHCASDRLEIAIENEPVIEQWGSVEMNAS